MSGQNGVDSPANEYDERMQELRRHIAHVQDRLRKKELRREKELQDKAEKWTQYKADMKKQRDDDAKQRHLQKQSLHEPQQYSQPCLRTQFSGQISTENGAQENSVVVVPLSKGDNEVHVDSRVSTARKSQVFPPIAQCHESCRGSESSGRQRHARKETVTFPRVRKKKENVAMTPRVGIQREKSVMQVAQEEFQGLCKSADGVAILKLGSARHMMHREALVRLDRKAVEEIKLELVEDQVEQEQQNETQEQPTTSPKHVARRYRFRKMQQMTSQVLQCRRRMADANHQMSFLSLHEPNRSSQLELLV